MNVWQRLKAQFGLHHPLELVESRLRLRLYPTMVLNSQAAGPIHSVMPGMFIQIPRGQPVDKIVYVRATADMSAAVARVLEGGKTEILRHSHCEQWGVSPTRLVDIAVHNTHLYEEDSSQPVIGQYNKDGSVWYFADHQNVASLIVHMHRNTFGGETERIDTYAEHRYGKVVDFPDTANVYRGPDTCSQSGQARREKPGSHGTLVAIPHARTIGYCNIVDSGYCQAAQSMRDRAGSEWSTSRDSVSSILYWFYQGEFRILVDRDRPGPARSMFTDVVESEFGNSGLW